MNLLKWLHPGLKVKRWFVLFLAGVLVAAVGLAMFAGRRLLGAVELNLTDLLWALTGRFVPRRITGAAVAVTGLGIAVFAIQRLVLTLIQAVSPRGGRRLGELLFERRQLERGPRLVVVGGGTGLPVLLRGLKEHTANLTAIVTVADDGGSSGRLRGELGVLPPGDVRNCLVALADREPVMERLFQYRFGSGEGLAGHSFGNLFIAAMSALHGDFQGGVKEASRVLAVRGQVLPATLSSVVLCGQLADGTVVRGESAIPAQGKDIVRVWLEPDCAAVPDAIEAIRAADAVVIGPGSLYTSIIPNLLVKGMAAALREAQGPIVYVANIMTQPGETTGYSVGGHIRAIRRHAGEGLISHVLLSTSAVRSELLARYAKEGSQPVPVSSRELEELGVRALRAPLLAAGELIRHDPGLLAEAVLRLVQQARTAAGKPGVAWYTLGGRRRRL